MFRYPIPRLSFLALLPLILVAAIVGCDRTATTAGDSPSCGSGSGVIYASLSIRCGGDIYTVSTGNNAGECETTEGTSGTGVVCTDKKGNGASMGCVAGVGKCLESSGAGSCSIKGG
jgi:hypothetical protein